MKIHSAVDITKKIKRVEWIQDRPKQEIDATRDITNEGTDYEVADLLQERSRRQSVRRDRGQGWWVARRAHPTGQSTRNDCDRDIVEGKRGGEVAGAG